MKATLYVGCALRLAPPEFVSSVLRLKERLRDHFIVIDFVGLKPDVPASTIYTTDIECAASADIMLAICDEPSTGLGMEIQKRIELRKKTYVAYRAGSTVSKMVTGAAETYPFMHTVVYTSIEDLFDTLSTL
jgi:hypothetical protein